MIFNIFVYAFLFIVLTLHGIYKFSFHPFHIVLLLARLPVLEEKNNSFLCEVGCYEISDSLSIYLVGICVLVTLSQRHEYTLLSLTQNLLYTMIRSTTYFWGKSSDEMFDITCTYLWFIFFYKLSYSTTFFTIWYKWNK